MSQKEYFPFVNKVEYEGPGSSNPFAFKWYDPNRLVGDKTMAQHFKFAMAYWHTLCNTGGDPFGPGTKQFPWTTHSDVVQRARDKFDAGHEFLEKMGLEYFCFHDFDLIDEGNSLSESEARLQSITDYIKERISASGKKVLWGTANLFSHPRYMSGAATNPDFNVVAFAGAQVKNAIDATLKLGGENYVFWGGREGYMSLLNTNMKRELDHLAQFLHLAKDYARSQGFKGTFFIEPKPSEPSKHQYDYDAATVIGFLREYDLLGDFKLNLEVNHATLAQHTFQHEMAVAVGANALGSIDANRGDEQNGWDTDQFPNNLNEAVEIMIILLQSGGLQGGGINFDAKTRRNSTDLEDIFFAHIGGMDIFARGLLIAHTILEKSEYNALITKRYASFDDGPGAEFESGKLSLTDLHRTASVGNEPKQLSGRQERFENLINQYI